MMVVDTDSETVTTAWRTETEAAIIPDISQSFKVTPAVIAGVIFRVL
jgi:hypothetical protein